MNYLKWIIDGICGGIVLFFLFILGQHVFFMYANHEGITIGEFFQAALMFIWLIGWVLIYWNGLIWTLDNRKRVSNWLKPKLDYLILGLLAFSYIIESSLIDTFGNEFPRPFSLYILLTTLSLYIFSWFFIKFFPRFSYSLKITSLVIVWFVFTCLLFLKLFLLRLM